MSRYDRNSTTWLEPKWWDWNTGFVVVRLAQFQSSGFSCGKTHCNSSVPVLTLTRNSSSVWELLLTLSADSLQCHFGKEGIQTCGFDEAMPGVFLSQPSPFDTPETQHHVSSHLRPRREVSWWDISFPWLRHGKPLYGLFGHIQGEAHVGLFQLYPTSLPCHCSRYIENLQAISCCF